MVSFSEVLVFSHLQNIIAEIGKFLSLQMLHAEQGVGSLAPPAHPPAQGTVRVRLVPRCRMAEAGRGLISGPGRSEQVAL